MCKYTKKSTRNTDLSTRFSYSGRGEHSIRMPFDDYGSVVSDHKLFGFFGRSRREKTEAVNPQRTLKTNTKKTYFVLKSL